MFYDAWEDNGIFKCIQITINSFEYTIYLRKEVQYFPDAMSNSSLISDIYQKGVSKTLTKMIVFNSKWKNLDACLGLYQLTLVNARIYRYNLGSTRLIAFTVTYIHI